MYLNRDLAEACSGPLDGTRERGREQCLRGRVYGRPLPPPAADAPSSSPLRSRPRLASSPLSSLLPTHSEKTFIHSFFWGRRTGGRDGRNADEHELM